MKERLRIPGTALSIPKLADYQEILLVYDNVSDTVGLNSRLRFNPRAGEDLYIVWNHNSDALAAFSGLSSRESEFTVKYSRTFRF